MGNPNLDRAPAVVGAAVIHTFYSHTSWIEGVAVDQLKQVAAMPGVRQVAAFPDLHPGKYGPVGCAILADRIYPHFIGNDIGCGMSLFKLDIPARKIRVDKVAQKLRGLQGPWNVDAGTMLAASGLPKGLHAQTLGTIGGGNHFCELQKVSEIIDVSTASNLGIDTDSTFLLVHSGSRSFGTEAFAKVQNVHLGFDTESEAAHDYLQDHNLALRWASLNRQIIADRAAENLRANCMLVSDSPHNLIEQTTDGYLHRKGAAKADIASVPLAGSRDAFSYLLKPNVHKADALSSLAHGAGRKYDRSSMLGRVGKTKSDREKLQRTSFGGQVVCEDRQLIIEEAPSAYKDVAQVLDALVVANLASPIISLQPLVTFKKASAEKKEQLQSKQARLLERRKQR